MSAMRGSSREAAMAIFFELLEQRFGSIGDLYERGARVIEARATLEKSHLVQLFTHEACAIHVRSFFPEHASAALARQVLAKEAQNWEISSVKGLESTDVMTLGTPYNVVIGKGEPAVREYFSSALPTMRAWRAPASEGAAPTLSPLDKLRLELDELWESGATVTKTAAGQAYHPGMFRIMRGPTRNVDGFIHVDELAPLLPGRGLFSANIYLQMPPAGGELRIWPLAWRRRWDFYRHAQTLSLLTSQAAGAQERLRRILPLPLTLLPRPGDLVLICAQRPHAAEGFPIGTRVSAQAFLSVEPGKPISLDS